MSGAKVKGISAFCLNENPTKSSPFSVEVSSFLFACKLVHVKQCFCYCFVFKTKTTWRCIIHTVTQQLGNQSWQLESNGRLQLDL